MKKLNYFDKLIEDGLKLPPVKLPKGTAEVEYVVVSVMNDLPFCNVCFSYDEMVQTVRHFLMSGHYLVRVMGEFDVYFNSLYQFDEYLKETLDVDKKDLIILKGMLNNINRLNHHNINVGTAGMMIQDQINFIEEKIQKQSQEGK